MQKTNWAPHFADKKLDYIHTDPTGAKNPPLITAIHFSNHDMLHFFLMKLGMNPNQKDSNGNTALIRASQHVDDRELFLELCATQMADFGMRNHHKQMILHCTAQGFDPQLDGMNTLVPLCIALQRDVAIEQIESTDFSKSNPLFNAVVYKHEDWKAKLLVLASYSADLNAVNGSGKGLMKYLKRREDRKFFRACLAAVDNGVLDQVRRIVSGPFVLSLFFFEMLFVLFQNCVPKSSV